MDTAVEYSIVVPVYNSSSTLEQLVREITEVLQEFQKPFEIVLTNDCSPDNSWEIMQQLAEQHDHVRIFHTAKNAGQMGATIAGVHNAKGKYIITTDDDLQYPPEEMKKLIKAIHLDDYDIVYGAPGRRMHNMYHNFIAKIVMIVFDYILLPGYRHINFYTTFRIFRRRLFFKENNEVIADRNLFFFWEIRPDKMLSIPVEHEARKIGRSNQTFFSLLKHYRPQIWWGGRVFSKLVNVLTVTLAIILAALHLLDVINVSGNLIILVGAIWVLSSLSYIWSVNMLKNIKRIDYTLKD